MKKLIVIALIIIAFVFILILLLGIYKFNYLSGKPGYDVDGNIIKEQTKHNTGNILPSNNGKYYIDSSGVS